MKNQDELIQQIHEDAQEVKRLPEGALLLSIPLFQGGASGYQVRKVGRGQIQTHQHIELAIEHVESNNCWPYSVERLGSVLEGASL